MGYQFVHLESYACKADAKGRSVDYILGEASRRPDCSVHVSNPLPPVIVFGVGVDQVQAWHDSAIASATVEVKGGKRRKVRSDQKSLHTVVASHPYTMEEVRADPSKKQEAEEWERRTIAWLQAQYGDNLRSVIRHEDESHWHVHAYVLPLSDPEFKAIVFHPGVMAKRRVLASEQAYGEDSSTRKKRGDEAYVAAMRQWQESYYDAVAAPCGLTRLGPQRRRLTRSEWQREKAQAKALQRTIERAAVVKGDGQKFLDQMKLEAAKITTAAQKQMDLAKKANAIAVLNRQQAVQEKLEAAAIMKDAARYVGLSGKVVAVWDRLKKSDLIQKVRSEFQREIDQWRKRAREADEKRLKAERKLYEAERRERELREEVLHATVERDHLKALMAISGRSDVTERLNRSPKLKLNPSSTKNRDNT